jgi:colanic acid/amylovoran biosynthesis glycosyltransferase
LQPEILHSHFGNNGWKALRTAEHFDLRHFVSFYGQDVSRLPKQNPVWINRYQELFNSTQTRFLCEGSHMAQCLVAMGCDRDKVQVHHLGVEVDKIPYRPRKWQASEPLRVLLAASFREKKGLPYALEALGRLRTQLPLEITIIGDAGKDHGSRQEKQKMMDIIARHQLGGSTRLLGYQPQPVLWEQAFAHHLFLSPSITANDGDTEGGAPVSLIEMAASGMPVVSSFHCDIPEVIRHGETGWLAPERDVSAIVNAIEQWLNQPDDWETMLHTGRQHIEQHYDARTQGMILAQHYKNSLTGQANTT